MTVQVVVDLDDLDSGMRAWIESLQTSTPVLVRRDGQTIGTVTYSRAVLEGTIISVPATHDAPVLREGTKVLATTMCPSRAARDLLRHSFGPDWVILDFHDAPDTADVVLTGAHSPQLTHRWTLLFPHAQIIVTEILDPGLGLDISGPVGRLLDAGAHAYLPPRPLEQIAESVQMYVGHRGHGTLGTQPPIIHHLNS